MLLKSKNEYNSWVLMFLKYTKRNDAINMQAFEITKWKKS